MDEAATVIRHTISHLLSRRMDVLLLACRQRAKFEGWLKFELASALAAQADVQNVVLEDGYSSGRRSDISFSLNGKTWYVELKTPNVNWRAAGIENRTRPITKNIDSLIEDVRKLKRDCASQLGLAVFCLFPIPSRIWKLEREKLAYHMGRIEQDCQLMPGSLIAGAEYNSVTDEYGICTFIVQAGNGE